MPSFTASVNQECGKDQLRVPFQLHPRWICTPSGDKSHPFAIENPLCPLHLWAIVLSSLSPSAVCGINLHAAFPVCAVDVEVSQFSLTPDRLIPSRFTTISCFQCFWNSSLRKVHPVKFPESSVFTFQWTTMAYLWLGHRTKIYWWAATRQAPWQVHTYFPYKVVNLIIKISSHLSKGNSEL